MNFLEKIPEIVRRIVNACQPEKIILFGSYARGDHGPDSDLDLLVIIPEVESNREESTRLRGKLMGMLVPVDIIVVTP